MPRHVPVEQVPGSRSKNNLPASRVPYDEPFDPVSETIRVARQRGLDVKTVLEERRRVLRGLTK